MNTTKLSHHAFLWFHRRLFLHNTIAIFILSVIYLKFNNLKYSAMFDTLILKHPKLFVYITDLGYSTNAN